MRRAVLAVVATLAMLLATLLTTAAAPAATVVVQVLGRRAVTYSSYPSDPTPTAKWTASAQGESVDTNGNGIADSLRGRAAVLETFGIIRARIYSVRTQALIGGVWTTVQANEADVVSEASRAYAVSYTPVNRYCGTDPTLTRTYRVVNAHGVRRVDGIVANRTLVSNIFSARALASDPDCPEVPPPPPPPPPAQADVRVTKTANVSTISSTGVTTFSYTIAVTNLDADDNAGNVVVSDILPPEVDVVTGGLPANCTLDADPAEPDVLTCTFGFVAPTETETAVIGVSTAGGVLSDASVTNTARVSSSTADPNLANNTATLVLPIRPLADVSVDKSADQASVTVPGDQFRYVLRVANAGPSAAADVTVVDQLPDGLEIVALPAECADDPSPLLEPDTITCTFASLAAGATVSVSIDVVTDATRADDTVPYVNTARVTTSTYEVNQANNADTVTTPVSAA